MNAAIFTSKTESFFASTPRIPKDAIFALTAQYMSDCSPFKVNLGQGTYRDDAGRPWVLPSVAEARRRLNDSKLDHEYLPILGQTDFRKAACKMIIGEGAFDAISSRLASCQSLSGTGSLHLAASLIKQYSLLQPTIWIPEPTWSNHHLLFASLKYQCRSYRYYDPSKKTIDMKSYVEMLHNAEPHSIVLLHACAHNPSGCDPTATQWREIGQIIKQRQLFPLFDAAYLGFNSGSVMEDTYPIRLFINELELETAVCVSFAKNMGLYGERIGCSIFATRDATIAANIESALERLQRSVVSNPPAYGAKIASLILNDKLLLQMWSRDLTTMCTRIKQMREALHNLLLTNGAPGNWTHIVRQSGMFSLLGLEPEVVTKLKENHHIYMADNSRISLAGLNTSNVAYVAKSISQVLQEEQQTKAHKPNSSL